MSNKEKTIKDILEIEIPTIEVPYNVHRVFGCKEMLFSYNCVSFCENGDYVNLADAREAIDWYVEQLGGRKVRWAK
jgi:hypothetical protein